MPEFDLEELERLAKAADPLPWKLKLHLGKVVRITEHGNERYVADCLRVDKRDKSCKRNAAYIVAACNAVPELIKRVRELERQRDILAHRLADAAQIPVKAYSAEMWIELAEITVKESEKC